MRINLIRDKGGKRNFPQLQVIRDICDITFRWQNPVETDLKTLLIPGSFSFFS